MPPLAHLVHVYVRYSHCHPTSVSKVNQKCRLELFLTPSINGNQKKSYFLSTPDFTCSHIHQQPVPEALRQGKEGGGGGGGGGTQSIQLVAFIIYIHCVYVYVCMIVCVCVCVCK